MKKVLLASTVLAMTATVAAAEVSVTGAARMGVAYNSEAPNEFGFTSRLRVIFSMSGETDSGLSFGASVRADNAGSANSGTSDVNGAGSMTGGSVFVSGAFGTVSMGDVDGAAEFVTGDLAGVGLTGLGDENENTFLSNSGSDRRSAARYVYTTGGLTLAVSADNPQNDSSNPAVPAVVGPPAVAAIPAGIANTYSVGVGYSMDAYSFGLGYETTDIAGVSVDHIIASGEGTFGGVTVKAVYGDASEIDFTQYGLSASYSMDALTVTGFHRVSDEAGAKDKYTGIGASYDLGGGARIVGGLVDVNAAAPADDETRADLGISLSF